MPWLSIIVWLISYFISTKNGMSAGKAALVATAAGVGTYYLADPSNKGNILGVSLGDSKTTPGDVSGATVPTTQTTAPSLGSTALTEIGSTFRSWGPVGTAGVVATTTGALTDNKWLLYGGAAVLAIALLK